jgi:hypothetical protein
MKKTITIFMLVLISLSLLGTGKPTVTISLATIAPLLDGTEEETWDAVDPILIDGSYAEEVPSISNGGTSYWKALWNEEGIYILVHVFDNVYAPNYTAIGNEWNQDKIETYFDMNGPLGATIDEGLADGKGPSAGINSGHSLFGPAITTTIDGGNVIENTNTSDGYPAKWALKKTGIADLLYEQFIPFTSLKNKEGGPINKSALIGFDIVIIDNDSGTDNKNRAVWSNTENESWLNMDDAGTILLERGSALIHVKELKITPEDVLAINTEAGKLQFTAEVLPENTLDKSITWSVLPGGTGKATITQNGLLTAVLNGIVTVQVKTNGYDKVGNQIIKTFDITISNQIESLQDKSCILDGSFDNTTIQDPWIKTPDNLDNSIKIADGMVVADINQPGYYWQSSIGQRDLNINNYDTYELSFNAYSDTERTIDVDFEDRNNGYSRFGSSLDPDAIDGQSQWHIELSTTPTKYTRHVVFYGLLPNTDKLFNIFFAGATGKVFIDSVYLINTTGSNFTPSSDFTITTPGNKKTINLINGTLQFTASTENIIWSVLPVDSGKASISNKGLLTAIANGKVMVQASTAGLDADGKHIVKTIEVTITNQAIPVTDITITTPENVTEINTENGTLQLNGKVSPINASNTKIYWSILSGGTGKAIISKTGLLTAIADGKVTIQASSDGLDVNDNYITKTIEITISNQPILLEDLTLTTPDNVLTIDTNGGTLQLSAIITPNTVINNTVNWQVLGDTSKATISVTGLLTAKKNGFVTVKATTEGFNADGNHISKNIIITITNQYTPITDLTITTQGNIKTIDTYAGQLQFFGTIEPEGASFNNVFWSILPGGTGNATINSSGLLTAIENGTVIVQAATEGVDIDDNHIFKTVEITITNQQVPVSSLTITAPDNVFAINTNSGTLQLTGMVLPNNAFSTIVYWAIFPGGTGKASISSTGLLTAIENGTVIIQASTDGLNASGDHIFKTKNITITNQTTSIKDPSTTNTINLSPNPVISELKIRTITTNCKVSIYNSLGQTMNHTILKGTEGSFDVSNYPKGIYFVKVGSYPVEKFVK